MASGGTFQEKKDAAGFRCRTLAEAFLNERPLGKVHEDDDDLDGPTTSLDHHATEPRARLLVKPWLFAEKRLAPGARGGRVRRERTVQHSDGGKSGLR